MRNQISEALAILASAKYQMKYIVDASKEEYVLPDEILDRAISILQLTLKSPVLSKSLKENELDCLAATLKTMEKSSIPFEDPKISNFELITQNSSWLEIQNTSRRCLDELHFDLIEWERDNV